MSKLHQIISCHAIAISLFLVAVTAFAEPSSSLTLRFGPAFQSLEAESVQVRAEPAYTFSVQSFQQSTQGTQVQIRVAGPASPPAVFPPEIICFCGSLPGAASVSDFSFAFSGASSLPVSFLATSAGLFIGPPSPFQGSIDQMFFGAPNQAAVTIGELETSTTTGTEQLSRFAADFRVQFMTSEMGVTPDPVTGLLILGPILTPIPGDWYEGSLRFHSATPAFAFLAAVPEPSALALSVIGLFFLVLISRRSLGTH